MDKKGCKTYLDLEMLNVSDCDFVLVLWAGCCLPHPHSVSIQYKYWNRFFVVCF